MKAPIVRRMAVHVDVAGREVARKRAAAVLSGPIWQSQERIVVGVAVPTPVEVSRRRTLANCYRVRQAVGDVVEPSALVAQRIEPTRGARPKDAILSRAGC